MPGQKFFVLIELIWIKLGPHSPSLMTYTVSDTAATASSAYPTRITVTPAARSRLMYSRIMST